MTAALVKRGPDGEGYYEKGPIALGHRRLSIIDLKTGDQPLFAEGGAVAGVINGEIYNFRRLREQLRVRGHTFATASDSEVVVAGYAEWGVDMLDHIEGQFALAVWDARDQTLLLARDRMGEKPLYWSRLDSGDLVFASALRALLRHPQVARQIDPRALARYLVYEYVPAPMSMVRGVHKLEPGWCLLAHPGAEPKLQPYWDLPVSDVHVGGRRTELAVTARELRAALERSVRDRLVSDVPLGIFLSGGLDSSLVAALAARERERDIDTFSVSFADPSYDEGPYAKQVATHIGSHHHERRVEPSDLLGLIPHLGELLDEPLGDGSLIPTHLLSRFAREHVTVALGGDGGDELFGGYPTFQAERATGRLLGMMGRRCRGLARRVGDQFAARLPVSTANFSFDFKLKQFLRGVDQPAAAHRHQAWLASLLPGEVPGVLAPALHAAATEDLLDIVDNRLARCSASNRWDRLMYFYCKGYLGDDVLAKVDRASMEVSLEVRAPLLDRDIIRLACQATPSLRVRGWQTKRLLKAAARGLVPDHIIDRPKHGFGMPIARWLREDLADFLGDTLAPTHLAGDGFFDPAAVSRLVDDHIAGRANHRKALWTLLAFQTWWDQTAGHATSPILLKSQAV